MLLTMAAARSTLLEGLEEISEDEQLRRVLEMSRCDNNVMNVMHDSVRTRDTVTNVSSESSTNMSRDSTSSFEDWARIPAEQRLQMISDPSAFIQRQPDKADNVENNTETEPSDIYLSDTEEADEEIRKVLEQSKHNTVMSEYDKIKLAMDQSKLEAKCQVTSLEQQLEQAIKLSLDAEYMTTNTQKTRHNSAGPSQSSRQSSLLTPDTLVTSSSPPSSSTAPLPAAASSPRRPRPSSLNTGAVVRSAGDQAPPTSPSLVSSHQQLQLTEEQQLELALKQSQEEQQLGVRQSQQEQLQLALRQSQQEQQVAEQRSQDPGSMSEEEQLKYVLRLSRSESAHTVPLTSKLNLPSTRTTPGFAPTASSLSRSATIGANIPSHGDLGARPRVSQPASSSSNNSTPAKGSLRKIVLDGSNICMNLGRHEDFVAKGLLIAYEWFSKRGHEVVAVLPKSRYFRLKKEHKFEDLEILDNMEKSNILVYTPCRATNERTWTNYDDIFIVEYAAMFKAIVVTNDQMRELQTNDGNNKEIWKEQIVNR